MPPRPMLIVEDDPYFAEILCAAMALRCWRPSVAPTLIQARDILRAQAMDVTILDLSLPDSEAGDTLDQIRDLIARGAGRVIIITGADMSPELTQAAVEAGAMGVIGKADLGYPHCVDAVIGRGV